MASTFPVFSTSWSIVKSAWGMPIKLPLNSSIATFLIFCLVYVELKFQIPAIQNGISPGVFSTISIIFVSSIVSSILSGSFYRKKQNSNKDIYIKNIFLSILLPTSAATFFSLFNILIKNDFFGFFLGFILFVAVFILQLSWFYFFMRLLNYFVKASAGVRNISIKNSFQQSNGFFLRTIFCLFTSYIMFLITMIVPIIFIVIYKTATVNVPMFLSGFLTFSIKDKMNHEVLIKLDLIDTALICLFFLFVSSFFSSFCTIITICLDKIKSPDKDLTYTNPME